MTARTLADMTPAERADCVGRWVKVTPTGGNCPSRTPFLGVLASLDANAYWGKGGNVVRGPHTSAFYFAEMELQTDLPRAWTPAGEPVDMDIETGRVEHGRIWYGSEIMQRTNLPDGTTVHRHVTDWEAAADYAEEVGTDD